jgi:hypothetical protein
MNNKIIIPLSKRKALVAWGGSTVFVVVGYLMFIHPENFMSIIVRNIAIVKSVGAMSMIFFGCCFIAILLKLLDSKPGLTIDDTGITFNTSALGVGTVEWNDIIRVTEKQVVSTRLLILNVRNPLKYINERKNFLSKQAFKMNYKTYGSPVVIFPGSLQLNFDSLKKLIEKELRKRQNDSLA